MGQGLRSTNSAKTGESSPYLMIHTQPASQLHLKCIVQIDLLTDIPRIETRSHTPPGRKAPRGAGNSDRTLQCTCHDPTAYQYTRSKQWLKQPEWRCLLEGQIHRVFATKLFKMFEYRAMRAEKKRQFGSPRRRWHNIKMDFTEIFWGHI